MEFWERLNAIAIKAANASGGVLRVARNEEDDTEDSQPEAQEFLKFNGRRLGRDFRMYAFMAKIAGPGQALADFAPVMMVIEKNVPAAFHVVREDVIGLRDLVAPKFQDEWSAIWDERSPHDLSAS